jgi:hypothetical protein
MTNGLLSWIFFNLNQIEEELLQILRLCEILLRGMRVAPRQRGTGDGHGAI